MQRALRATRSLVNHLLDFSRLLNQKAPEKRLAVRMATRASVKYERAPHCGLVAIYLYFSFEWTARAGLPPLFSQWTRRIKHTHSAPSTWGEQSARCTGAIIKISTRPCHSSPRKEKRTKKKASRRENKNEIIGEQLETRRAHLYPSVFFFSRVPFGKIKFKKRFAKNGRTANGTLPAATFQLSTKCCASWNSSPFRCPRRSSVTSALLSRLCKSWVFQRSHRIFFGFCFFFIVFLALAWDS